MTLRRRLDPDDCGEGAERGFGGFLRSLLAGIPWSERATGEERVSLTTLRSLQIPLASGRTVPLSQLATLSFDQETPLIWRRDRVPTLTVRADVVPGVLPESVAAKLGPGIDELNSRMPPGYQVVAGGTVEESARSQASVFAVVPIMVLLMLTFLMIQLHSFSRMGLVLTMLPLCMIGVVGGLLLAGKPLGFVAILGILALLGMIAIAGTVFWGPMAVTVMGGLFVATLLTLIVLPALYVAVFRIGPDDPPDAPAGSDTAAVPA